MQQEDQPSFNPFALRFFRWFCKPDYAEDIEGDLLERFERRQDAHSHRYASRLLLTDVLGLLRPNLIKPLFRQKLKFLPMLKHDLRIGWRSLLRSRSTSLINLGGLALGMAVAILIGLWIYDELSFNKVHDNYERIAMVGRHEIREGELSTNTVHPAGLGTAIADQYGHFFKEVVIFRWKLEERLFHYGDKRLIASGHFMQEAGPELLSLQMLSGSHSGLSNKEAILLSASLAKKLFADENPIGKLLKMDARQSLIVTGVYQDLPSNSTFGGSAYIAPLELFVGGPEGLHVWDNYNVQVMVGLQQGVALTTAAAGIKDVMLDHFGRDKSTRKPQVFLEPMHNWHLNSKYENGKPVSSERLRFVWFYAIIGCFILALACINFINISTARATTRMKEIGIRKSLGALRGRLVTQFLTESMLLTGLSLLLALLLVILVLPHFNSFSAKTMRIDWSQPYFWAAILGFALLSGLLSGLYPSLVLAGFNTIRSLKGKVTEGSRAALPRRLLVTFQFTVSISLIIATLVVSSQIEHAKNRTAGYNQDRLIYLRPATPDYYGKYGVLREQLLQSGVVEEMTETNYEMTSSLGWNDDFEWQGKNPDQAASFNTILGVPGYCKTMGLEFVEGRPFDNKIATDKDAIIINESAADLLQGLERPLTGKKITFNQDYFGGPRFTIVGVVKDVVKGSPFQETFPMILFSSEFELSFLYIRIKPEVDLQEALASIEEVFTAIIPSAPFEYTFADVAYQAKFEEEQRIFALSKVLSGLAVLISCIGLFGLVSYVAERRTKEIGIRKVLGASLVQLWQLLTREFAFLVTLSCLVALPLAWWLMSTWLEQYSYRISIEGWMLAVGGLAGLVVTLITVSIHTLRVARLNPVHTLKDE